MNDSIHNLFCFYREIGKTGSVTIDDNPEHCAINAENGFWPQMIFDIHFAENEHIQPEQFLARIMNDAMPDFAVCDAGVFKPESQSFLRKSGIYPVKTWTLMEFSLDEKIVIQEQKNQEFRELKTTSELEDFCSTVNVLLMGNIKISFDLIENLVKSPEIKFYGLYVDNELASILLSFTENNISGLYFIATKPEYRGKKLAELLIRQTANLLLSQKSEKVVLQAVQKAVPLYSRIGFKPCGKLTIFWKRQHATGKNSRKNQKHF